MEFWNNNYDHKIKIISINFVFTANYDYLCILIIPQLINMASSEQILSLIRNHLNNDDSQFKGGATDFCSWKNQNGHVVLSRTIQELLSAKNTCF